MIRVNPSNEVLSEINELIRETSHELRRVGGQGLVAIAHRTQRKKKSRKKTRMTAPPEERPLDDVGDVLPGRPD